MALTGTFTGRWIVPVTRPPIYRGWVQFRGGRVVALGAGVAPEPAVDCGDVALMPALTNAHTHLEFSDLPKPLGQPGQSLPEWIGAVVRHRRDAAARLGDDGLAAQRRQAIEAGLAESHTCGVGIVGEIATLPWLQQLPAPAPEIVAFGEVLGLQSARSEPLRAATCRWLEQPPAGIVVGISPHAPYSTAGALIGQAIAWSQQQRRPLAMHVAESAEERELVETGGGPFRDILERLGAWREGMFPLAGGMAGLLKRLLAAPRVLIVHGNDLSDAEIELLAGRPEASVVYCPRTHRYFDHPRHPLPKLLAAGVRVALGTDSRASNPDLSVAAEAAEVRRQHPGIAPEVVLQMATRWGAEALGVAGGGQLAAGVRTRLVAVPTRASNRAALMETFWDQAPQPVVG